MAARQELEGRQIFGDMEANCGFLHRLDVPCSGLVMVAKTYEAYYDLLLQMNSGSTLRDYVVLCHGHVDVGLRRVDAPLYWAEGTRLATQVRRYGRPAATELKVLAHGVREGLPVSLVALRILTGRRHQIRAHMAHVHHPLATCPTYSL